MRARDHVFVGGPVATIGALLGVLMFIVPGEARADHHWNQGLGLSWDTVQSFGLYGDSLLLFSDQPKTFAARAGLNVGLGGAGIQLGLGRVGSDVHFFAPLAAGFFNVVLVRPWWISPIEQTFHGGFEITGHVFVIGLGAAALWRVQDVSSFHLAFSAKVGFP
jgi:hypothetical protein